MKISFEGSVEDFRTVFSPVHSLGPALLGDEPPLPPPLAPPCNCPDPCANEGSFGLAYCEDGVLRIMAAPTGAVTVVPVFDPSIPGWTYATWPP